MSGPAPRLLPLAPGRVLALAEYGDPQGRPVLYFHGFPGSRLEAALTGPAARACGVRLLALDRPGYGGSPFQPGRRILDWPADIAAVLDVLHLARAAVLGVSGGGPYALACAYALPARISVAGVVGGLGGLDAPAALQAMDWPARLGFRLARTAPRLLHWVYGGTALRMMRRRPEVPLWLLTRRAPPADRRVLVRREVRDVLRCSMREALRQGERGPMRDLVLYARPWGFALEDVDVPVQLWHGEADQTVPVLHGRRAAARLPRVQARFLAAQGHFSLPVEHAAAILEALRGRATV